VQADRKQHDILDAASRADPRFARRGRGSRQHRAAVPVGGAAELQRELGDDRSNRGRLGVDGGDAEQRRRATGDRRLNLLERLRRGARQITARLDLCASQHVSLIVDGDGVRTRVVELYAQHRGSTVIPCPIRC